MLALPLASKAEDSTNVRDALKEAGLSTLPTFLDAATESISITFPKALGGKTLTFGGNIDADALQEKRFKFETADGKGIKWDNAFGMSFLDLHDVGLNLEIAKHTFKISLDGEIGGAFKKKDKVQEIVIEFDVEDKKLEDFTLSLPNTKLRLHDIHEFGSLPGAKELAIEDLTISMHAIGGKIDILKEETDAVMFYDTKKRGWNVGLRFPKPMTLGQLTRHNKGFLKTLALPNTQLLISHKGSSSGYDDLPLAAQNFFKDGDDLPDGDLDLEKGINILAIFDPDNTPKSAKKALAKLGLDNLKLEVEGTVEGIFGGDKALDIAVAIDMPKSHPFPFLKAKDEKAEFFIRFSEVEVDMGFRNAVVLSQGKGKPDLEFDVDFGMKETKSSIEAFVSGGMKGDWINAAGIKHFTLEDPFMTVGIDESGSFNMMIDGTVRIGSEKVRAAADLVLSPEALGLPTAFAVAGTINKINFNDIVKLAEKHSKPKGSFGHLDAGFKDVAFAFMTPDSTLPADLEEELHIAGSGMALSGTLLIHNKAVASAKGYASTEGMSFDGVLKEVKAGPIDLKGAELDIEATPKKSPKFLMKGDIELLKGFEEDFELDLEPTHLAFSSDTKFGKAFEVLIEAESDGLSMSSHNDFSFDAELDSKYHDPFHKVVEAAVKGLQKGDNKIKNARSKVNDAEDKVRHLKSKISDAKNEAQRAYDNATSKIDDAKKKVDHLKHLISVNNKKAHDADKKAKHEAKKLHFGKAAKYGSEAAAFKTAAGSEKASLKTAEWALDQAKKTVKIVPVDAAPKVVALQAELRTAQAGLEAAKGVLTAASKTDEGLQAALKAIGDGALQVNSLSVSGSLKGLTPGGKEGDKVMLKADVTLSGKRHHFHETLDLTLLEHGFEAVTKSLAKKVANELVNIFKKK